MIAEQWICYTELKSECVAVENRIKYNTLVHGVHCYETEKDNF